MKGIKNVRKGFTLLELLIVVLIIGILAAIALPKYQLAVDKTQFAKMQTMVNAVRKSYLGYVLLYGEGPDSFSDLDLDIPHEGEEFAPLNFFKCITLPDMYLCLSGGGVAHGGNVRAFKKDLSFIYVESLLTAKTLKDQFSKQCFALPNNDRANRLCRELTSNKIEPDNPNVSTPLGDYKRYYRYNME